MATDFDLVRQIVKDVELKSVILRAADLLSRVDPLRPPGDLQVEQGYRTRYELPDGSPDHVNVFVDLKFEAKVEEPEPTMSGVTVFSLDATYLLLYGLPGAAARDETELEHFARLNGTYNAWPYWRELVQTVTGRVGLASFIVPVLRLQPTTIDAQESLNPSAKGAAVVPGAAKKRVVRKKAQEPNPAS